MSKYDSIPYGACTFAAALQVGDNGEDSTTAPIRLLARSSQPIEHWFWGNVVHDTSGFNLNGKSRLPIDFDHDTGQAIGYTNRFEQEPEGLIMSGTLVSHGGDRAEKVMKDTRAGIPYEASINFGGNGIKVEEVAEGATSFVNGYDFAGPGVIIREYPLRGVAVTLYGADEHTSSQVFSDGDTLSASIITPTTEASEMSQPENTDAKEATAVELAQVEAAEVVESAEAVEVQAVEEEVAEVAELAAVEAPGAEAEEVEVATFGVDEFTKMVTEFGADVAAQVATNGGSYEDAREISRSAELEALRAEVAELRAKPTVAQGVKPASFSSTDTPGKPAKKRLRDATVIAPK